MYRWCQEHRPQLEEKGSSLEFKLHRLKYINLLVEGNITDALCYANNFVRFSKQNSKGNPLLGSISITWFSWFEKYMK